MKKFNKSLFVAGLIIYYFILFFSPKTSFIYGAHLIAAVFFYFSTKNIRLSLVCSLVLSLFSDIGRAGQFFQLEPQELNQGSGYFISPMTIIFPCLILLSFRDKIKSINFSDIIILFFFLWNLVPFFFFPYNNVLYGIISLSELIIIYFLLRIYIEKKMVKYIVIMMISMLAFQSMIGIMQLVFKRPIGIVIESSINRDQFGLVTAEDINLYRISGTFVHPNNFAAILLSILPFILLLNIINRWISLSRIVPLIVLFFTYTRSAWIIFIGIITLIFHMKGFYKRININLTKSIIIPFIIVIVTFFILVPSIIIRLNSTPQALEERGSMDVRFKLYEEAFSIISQYPLTGVGLNRSVETYVSNPVTNLLDMVGNIRFYKIHNVFLEIAAETGIPGATIFILFLGSVIWNYFKREKNYYRNAAFLGLIGLIGISMLNPFFHSSQFRLFFLLSAIILA